MWRVEPLSYLGHDKALATVDTLEEERRMVFLGLGLCGLLLTPRRFLFVLKKMCRDSISYGRVNRTYRP